MLLDELHADNSAPKCPKANDTRTVRPPGVASLSPHVWVRRKQKPFTPVMIEWDDDAECSTARFVALLKGDDLSGWCALVRTALSVMTLVVSRTVARVMCNNMSREHSPPPMRAFRRRSCVFCRRHSL
jgi:hypothetical protein